MRQNRIQELLKEMYLKTVRIKYVSSNDGGASTYVIKSTNKTNKIKCNSLHHIKPKKVIHIYLWIVKVLLLIL